MSTVVLPVRIAAIRCRRRDDAFGEFLRVLARVRNGVGASGQGDPDGEPAGEGLGLLFLGAVAGNASAQERALGLEGPVEHVLPVDGGEDRMAGGVGPGLGDLDVAEHQVCHLVQSDVLLVRDVGVLWNLHQVQGLAVDQHPVHAA
ncbi:hypothetical protein KDK95_05725 [Actinospica sp. MGRD01-02]|uniref:Uncharacterized protein n=1 Tax=Actinospica acidithermotolerans TaxID=2828514 RepID=A0A941EDH9_9ACTN|nr:hypothetical protein [Actinospica acidithermotolerans]MBR7825799.1 hypothetical protein [Actinospica acidithermotolerans]